MNSKKSTIGVVSIYCVLILWTVIVLFPLYWMFATSLKTVSEMHANPPYLIPPHARFSNYIEAWKTAPFARYFLNSFVITSISTVVAVFFCSLAGFAFAKYKFRGKEVLFFLQLVALMVPPHAVLIPNYVLITRLGWADSYTGVIIPSLVSAFGVFLMRQYIQSIPSEIMDAARIDGSSEFRIYLSIILPSIKPALAVLAIFLFFRYWNDFLWPLVVMSSPKMYTVQVGLSQFITWFFTDYNYLMGMTLLSIIPVIVVFLFCQKQFVRGIVLSGLK